MIYRKFKESDHRGLEHMIFSLYSEDECGESMSTEKIDQTICELSQHPQKGVITIFENDKYVVGYAIMIYFWSNELGGNIAQIDELYIKPECVVGELEQNL